jgi:hypothetical protein
MTQGHLSEIELARVSELENKEKLEGHLRWCSRCRRALADYGWVQGEIEALLEAEADAVPVPQANWQNVRDRLGRAERRNKGKEMLVVAGAALVFCLMVGTPAVLGRKAEAQAVPASGIVTAPVPVSIADPVTITSQRTAAGSASSSGHSREGVKTSLPFVPIPTPPTPHG